MAIDDLKESLGINDDDFEGIKDGVNALDKSTSKFRKGIKGAKSVINAAKGNIFEFPVFVSSSVPLDYATATTSLLEQVYASFLQMAISANPVITATVLSSLISRVTQTSISSVLIHHTRLMLRSIISVSVIL